MVYTSRKERIVEAEDADIIANLLAEYSEKLRNSYEGFYRIRQTRSVLGAAFILLLIVVLMALTIFWRFGLLGTNLQMIMVSVVSLLGITSYLYVALISQLHRMGFVKREVAVLASQLERLVRTASQFQEHGERNFGKRIELDLRLADAEGTLHLVNRLVRDNGDVLEKD